MVREIMTQKNAQFGFFMLLFLCLFFKINALLYDLKTNEEKFLWGFKIISN